MNNKELARLLLGDIKTVPEDIYKLYPKRILKEGAKVTRIAPSPTGFMHLGNLFGAICDEFLARQSDGIFYLRIEDTDEKRSVDGGVDAILSAFSSFGLVFDEGVTPLGEIGNYGPYYQSRRKDIYKTFVYSLIENGLAYPCFLTEDELFNMRQEQEANKENFGYYGKYALSRKLSLEQIKENLKANKPFVIRFKSSGSIENKFKFTDLCRGTLELTENNQDIVILKVGGLPTYHFAHVIDDYLMGTTHVVRGEEWLATLPIHLQLFRVLGWAPPKYIHTAQLMKIDEETGNKRKLSKRLDPELALDFYFNAGFPIGAVKEYLLTLLNSNFEEWRNANKLADIKTFPFSPKKMGTSGALFDMNKLRDISRNYIASLSLDEIFDMYTDFTLKTDKEFYDIIIKDTEYLKEILKLALGKPHKELVTLKDIKPFFNFFFDETFIKAYEFPANAAEYKNILTDYIEIFDINMDNEAWFNQLKPLAIKYGYAPETKLYKQNPNDFKGHIGDISTVIRISVTGRANSPDLYQVLKILGKEKIISRFKHSIMEAN